MWCIINIIRLIVEFLFIINLSGDTNVAGILYKSSQACTEPKTKFIFGTDRAVIQPTS